MSKFYNDCDIALELLPLYIEKKTGEESNLFLGKHLQECAECQQVHQLMAQDFLKDMKSTETISKPVIQTMKRRLLRLLKKVLIVFGGMAAYIGLMIGIIALVVRYLSGA